MEYSLAPSLPAQSFEEIEALCIALRGSADQLQIDIVDGAFVPLMSWPFTEADPRVALRKVKELTVDFKIGMDCMVLKPEQYLDLFVELGVTRVVIHMRSTEAYKAIFDHARTYGYMLGLAFTNDMPHAEVVPYIDNVDFVQVMGIAHVGQQGQPFDERTLDRVSTLRKEYPDLEIAIDGAVNAETIPQLRTAGANRFAPGSAIAKAENPLEAYKQLLELIRA